MGFAPRTKAELCWWQFLRLPQCLGDFLHPLALALPLLGICVLHTDPVSQMWSWGSATLVPKAGVTPKEGALLGPEAPWEPIQCSRARLLQLQFHREQHCPMIWVKKILRIFLCSKKFLKFTKTQLKNISEWIFHVFSLSSLVCKGLGRNCLFLHLFPGLQFLLSPSYCERKASALSECL